MESCQSDSYPSIKFCKYVILIITLIVFLFSSVKTKMVIENNKIKGYTSVDSDYLYTSNQVLTKISGNRINESMENTSNSKKIESDLLEIEATVPVVSTPSYKPEPVIIYDGLTEEQLTDKLNRSLKSTLSNTGFIFAKYTKDTGIDPYLAVAIVLHETGCKWNCSELVNQCNNVGGVKGGPTCNGGSYKAYPSLEEGIYAYLDNLYYNYYEKGLKTPEQINPYYAESTVWASAVNNYIFEIKNS